MKKYLYVGAFGFFGAMVRYFIKNIHMHVIFSNFPINTIIINVIGSFVLAALFTSVPGVLNMKEEMRLGIGTGFMGAFTTFSTMCKDTVLLLNSGKYFLSAVYISMSIAFGLCAASLGVMLVRRYELRISLKKKYEAKAS